MNYIKRVDNKTIVDGITLNITTTKYLNNYSKMFLKSYKEIIKVTKRKLNINKYVPLYFDYNNMLVPIYGIESIDYFAFNYYELKDFISFSDYSILYFYDGSSYKLLIDKRRMNKLLNNAKKVDNYIKNIISI